MKVSDQQKFGPYFDPMSDYGVRRLADSDPLITKLGFRVGLTSVGPTPGSAKVASDQVAGFAHFARRMDFQA